MDLSEYDKMYKDAKVQDKFSMVPDGKYQVFVDEISLEETKHTHKPMIKWTFKIMSGVHEGRLLWKNSVLTDDPKSMDYVKTDLSVCGLELKKFSDLQKSLGKLRNVQLEVQTKIKKGDPNSQDDMKRKDSQNVWINRKLEVGEADDGDDDSDTPF
jgi:hypothetical protein